MSTLGSVKSVPVLTDESVPIGEVGHIGSNHISRRRIKGIVIEKYRSSGQGITFEDVRERFRIKNAGLAKREVFSCEKGSFYRRGSCNSGH